MGMRPREIKVEIDELVLDGFDGVVGRSVADALESELAGRLRSSPELSLRSRQRALADPIGVPLPQSAPLFGRAIAQAVGKELA